jgi:hypothetical protein
MFVRTISLFEWWNELSDQHRVSELRRDQWSGRHVRRRTSSARWAPAGRYGRLSYTAGLIAPSIIGGIAQASNLTVSFILVMLLATGIAAFSGVLRPAGVRDAHLDG